MIQVSPYSSFHSHSLYKYRVFQSDEAYYSLLYLMHQSNCNNEITLYVKTEVFWYIVPCSLVNTGDSTPADMMQYPGRLLSPLILL
jgi:hypothetical protein